MSIENQVTDPEFEAFANSGEVEVGDSQAVEQPEEKPTKKRAPAKPDPEPVEADEQDEADEQEEADEQDEETDQDEADEQTDPKPKKSSKDYQIERLKREKAEMARQLRENEQRMMQEVLSKVENLEKRLQGENSGDNQNAGTPEPDPSDFEKYPLGHLDPAYIEDRIQYVAERKAAERAEAALQRQQEIDQQQYLEIQPLLEKVDELTTRGIEIYDDFKESVVDTGMRGDWDLDQPTFMAATKTTNGVQILYELAHNPEEASRVAKLSEEEQMEYVFLRNREIRLGKTPRRKPQAGEPPKNTARGANSRTSINPATDNLDDFEKAWELEARKGR
jgi:hypothetical protein